MHEELDDCTAMIMSNKTRRTDAEVIHQITHQLDVAREATIVIKTGLAYRRDRLDRER